jgi:hypothetical protein
LSWSTRIPEPDPAGVYEPAVGVVVPEQERADKRAAALGVGPADDHKFLPVEAFGLEPQPALSRAVTGIEPLRHDALEPESAGMPTERRPLPDLVVAVPDGVIPAIEKSGKTAFAGGQRERHQVPTIEVEKVEDEVDEVGTALSFRRVLDQCERGEAVRTHPA